MRRRQLIEAAGIMLLAGCASSADTDLPESTPTPTTTYDVREGKLKAFQQGLEEDIRTPITVRELFIENDMDIFGDNYIVNLNYITTQSNLEDFQMEQANIALFYYNYVTIDDWDVEKLFVKTYETETAAREGTPRLEWEVETNSVEHYHEGYISRGEFFERVFLSTEPIDQDS